MTFSIYTLDFDLEYYAKIDQRHESIAKHIFLSDCHL